jgi:CheY-like chemotaxis protein
LELRTTDLNQVIAGIERMLRRLLGEDIEMRVALAADLGAVQADPGQIEQVVMNLAVNARDAMPSGGTLTIETMNVELDEGYVTAHAAGTPGRYVLLAVADTGCGMDAEIQRRIFEPFFTTKGQGKGTGLGLATCHGIVSQTGGHIGVYSEPGRGTVFKVYLPRTDGAAMSEVEIPTEATRRGREAVLLVEDDPALRSAVQRMLSTQGYRVVVARDSAEAIELAHRHAAELALLVTDVVMPQISGPEVAKAVQSHVPQIKILFMSGYTDHSAFANGVLSPTVNFIQKPFSPQALAKKVRDALER